MWTTLRQHWPNYLIEAWGLGCFMISAGTFATLIYFPGSVVYPYLAQSPWQGVVMGGAMGLTAIALIYSPWGKRSGAHMNPAVTLAFWRLKKLAPWDALGYVLAQFIGGTLGVMIIAQILGKPFSQPPVHYVVTLPGQWGWFAALIAELLMAFGLMLTVLTLSNHPRWSGWTGVVAGLLVATYIALAAPISGTSLNPARSFASAVSAQEWTAFWIYNLAPPLAMLAAVEVYLHWTKANPRKLCGKLCPNSATPCPCIQCCCDAN